MAPAGIALRVTEAHKLSYHGKVEPTKLMQGFSKSGRKLWVTSNRLLTRHGKTAANKHRWNLRDTNRCRNCEGGPETTDHTILHCPVTVLNGGYQTVIRADDTLKDWIERFNMEV